MSFCDEHGTADYCGECIYGPEIEKLEQQNKDLLEALEEAADDAEHWLSWAVANRMVTKKGAAEYQRANAKYRAAIAKATGGAQ